MSICYALVDRNRRCTFDVGTHRDVYANALKEMLENDWEPDTLVELCVAEIRAAVTRFPQSYANPDPDAWAASIETRARRVLKFMSETNTAALVLVDDSGDDMDEFDGWPEVGSVYG